MVQSPLWHKCQQAPLQELHGDLFRLKGLRLFVLRLDQIHPIISGNKLFKLQYFVEAALAKKGREIVSFGGPYSNHLVATAYACKEMKLRCTGYVRGERPLILSHTLQHCLAYGMKLIFLPRREYTTCSQDFLENDAVVQVPEGGYHSLGAKGAADIPGLFSNLDPSHICVDIGTATTLAGILLGAKESSEVVAMPVLKGLADIPKRLEYLTGKMNYNNLSLHNDYHFGGYAKYTEDLLRFMNELYRQHALPTDFVYTAKLMYGVFDLIEKDYFKAGSRVVCIHSGGLQGNDSLPAGHLIF